MPQAGLSSAPWNPWSKRKRPLADPPTNQKTTQVGPALVRGLNDPLRPLRAGAGGDECLGHSSAGGAVAELATAAGYTRFRRAAECAFSRIVEPHP
jgi:hypothetical protein